MRFSRPIRALAFVLTAALGVHEVRSVVQLCSHVGSTDPYGWTPSATLMLAPLFALIATAGFVWLLQATAEVEAVETSQARPRRRWPLVSVAVVLVYALQELTLGALAGGHPVGVQGAIGHGGWIVVPLAIVVGALVASALRIVRVFRRQPGLSLPSRIPWMPPFQRVASGPDREPLNVLASPGAGRAPPFVVA